MKTIRIAASGPSTDTAHGERGCAPSHSASGLIVAGCGGSSAAENSAPAAAEEIESMSGSQLGDAAGATWTAAMEERLVNHAGGQARADDRQGPGRATQEQTVQKLVTLGRQGRRSSPPKRRR